MVSHGFIRRPLPTKMKWFLCIVGMAVFGLSLTNIGISMRIPSLYSNGESSHGLELEKEKEPETTVTAPVGVGVGVDVVGSTAGASDSTVVTGDTAQSITSKSKLLRSAQKYIPATVEAYIMKNLIAMGWDGATRGSEPEGCKIWKDSFSRSTKENYEDLQYYSSNLDGHTKAVQNYKSSNIPGADIMASITGNGDTRICKKLRLHFNGIEALFPSQQLSQTRLGYVEPLLTPMRHPAFCQDNSTANLMRLDYLVHDFEAMCMQLKPTSRRVLIDMGASLNFHAVEGNHTNPIADLLQLYEKFGFQFDDIYALEVNYTDPGEVSKKLIPAKYNASYHWINAGVSSEKGHELNPLDSIVRKFNEDDLIILILDSGTSSIEIPLALANQLLEDESLHKLVDHFYFEHRVHMKEMSDSWLDSMEGSLKDTFELMQGLRIKGVASHFWP